VNQPLAVTLIGAAVLTVTAFAPGISTPEPEPCRPPVVTPIEVSPETSREVPESEVLRVVAARVAETRGDLP